MGGITHPPASPSLTSSLYTPQGKAGLLYDQNQYDRRVKVPELRSRIYTHRKSHLILSQRILVKTAVLKVSENFQKNDFSGVLFKQSELSNLPPKYLKNLFHHKCFLWACLQFLRLLKSLFPKVTGEICALRRFLENSQEGLQDYLKMIPSWMF